MAQEMGKTEHWLDRYAQNYHVWRKITSRGQDVYQRRIGIVESFFDGDGIYFEGRADVNALLSLEVKSSLSPEQFRRHVLLAWTSLRLRHVILLARVQQADPHGERQLVISVPTSDEDAVAEAAQTIVFLEDTHGEVDPADLYQHCLNTARVIDPSKMLSRVLVLPLEYQSNGRCYLRFIQVTAHMITDGLSMYNWTSDFIDLLNHSESDLRKSIATHRFSEEIQSRLPPAQEDLYPPVPGSKARQRWFWAIMRVLRHVRKPLAPGFPNPLRRVERRPSAVSMPPRYSDVLNYSPDRKPPLNTFIVGLALSRPASERLHRLCRASKTSIGAGCFALVALTMMELDEAARPLVPPHRRRPFVASFPLNPRPFFNYTRPADSCMLAFSDGIVLPFLPSDLDLEGRFRLTARAAHRQLRMYQKGRGMKVVADAHSPARLLAQNYVAAVERAEAKLPEGQRRGVDPQGEYPANVNFGAATCGVSSVGPVKEWVRAGKYPLDVHEGKEVVADYRSVQMGVRARDNEFLVGSNSDTDGVIHFGVSLDGNAIEEGEVRRWKEKMEGLLEETGKAKL